jgi:septal ring factor EnvC (AmiA/AmiB activator)
VQRLNTEEVEALVAQAGAHPLAVAVHGLNLSLAHHAAWTEERFDIVERTVKRLDSRTEQMDKRLRSVEVSQHNTERRLGELEIGQARVERGIGQLEHQLETGFGEMGEQIRQLSAQVLSVLNFAVKDELKVHEIDE